MHENLMNSAHKATNEKSRSGYDGINWIKSPEERKKQRAEEELKRFERSRKTV